MHQITTHPVAAQCNLLICSHWQSHNTVSQI